MVSKGLDRFVLWPHYFDRSISRADGRRVSDALAVKAPDAKWIEVAAKRCGLDPQVEEKACHPTIHYEKCGRVLISRNGGPKQKLLHDIATKMRESQDAREER